MPRTHEEDFGPNEAVSQFNGYESLGEPASSAKSLEVQKADYLDGRDVPRGEVIRFKLGEGLTAYNPSHVIRQEIDGEVAECIAARVEEIGEELASTVRFYRKSTDDQGEVWTELEGDGAQVFQTPESGAASEADQKLLISALDAGTKADAPFGPISYQDPTIATGTLDGANFVVVAAVQAQELHRLDSMPDARRSEYHQEFWAGPSLDKLEKVAEGPKARKGTRLVHLGANKWGVFNRPQSPQGRQFGPGRITYAEFEAATPEEFRLGLEAALDDVDTVIPDLCTAEEWVGPNQGWPLADGRIGMIGHIARMVDASTGEREYCASSFIYDPSTNTPEDAQVIATKASFENVSPRPDRQDLNEVIYPGGADILPDGKLRLYCGVSDNAAGYVDIDDPFEGLRAS